MRAHIGPGCCTESRPPNGRSPRSGPARQPSPRRSSPRPARRPRTHGRADRRASARRTGSARASRLTDRIGLGDQRGGRGQITRPRGGSTQPDQHERQLAERTDGTDRRGLPFDQRAPGVKVPQGDGGTFGERIQPQRSSAVTSAAVKASIAVRNAGAAVPGPYVTSNVRASRTSSGLPGRSPGDGSRVPRGRPPAGSPGRPGDRRTRLPARRPGRPGGLGPGRAAQDAEPP